MNFSSIYFIDDKLLPCSLLPCSQLFQVPQIRTICSQYGFEAIISILTGQRAGVLGRTYETADPTYSRFMVAADTVFRTTSRMMFEELPFWLYFRTRSMREMYAAWDDLSTIGGKIFNSSKDPSLQAPEFKNDGAQPFFSVMDLESEPLTEGERTVMGIDLITAGVDTTSNAAQWAIVAMANHPEVQERLAAKLRQLMGDKPTAITAEHIQEAKLHDFIEEILRLYPILPANVRLFSKEARFVANYLIHF